MSAARPNNNEIIKGTSVLLFPRIDKLRGAVKTASVANGAPAELERSEFRGESEQPPEKRDLPRSGEPSK